MQSQIRKKLIEALSRDDHQFVSGQHIAELTGATRTAVWKHIEDLRKDGYEIEAVRRKGYRIVSVPSTLSADSIRMNIHSAVFGKNIHYQETIGSTQKTANELANEGAEEGTIVVADEQTLGRGRLARKWHSPKGTGIWMSLLAKPRIPLQQAPQLTLLTAVAVVQAIEEVTGLQAQIKWPNDILIKGKKVTGILTEMQAEADGVHSIIIGIGMNVNQVAADFPEELSDKATSLKIETGLTHSREQIIGEILYKFENLYHIYQSKGFKVIKALWESYAVSIGKVITATTMNDKIIGIAMGITDEGVLLIKDDKGRVHSIYSADIEI
ncbi:biotin--[acetyl-CoA-carboxylase] ligase [Bacillus testis]|uniref:biotin--[acetyl-CoA-carboxylase] ligase n=1 Tax=Bacillus testis TaxID=1622072 RepID=UPI00067EB5CD|nr:biotin--[acetyl-CoA-carboxylase] ligase [Bacillus testis]